MLSPDQQRDLIAFLTDLLKVIQASERRFSRFVVFTKAFGEDYESHFHVIDDTEKVDPNLDPDDIPDDNERKHLW